VKELLVSPEAQDDFLAIADFVSDSSTAGALRVIAGIQARMESLRLFPGSGHVHRDLPPSYRVLNAGLWTILYREEVEQVVIARIVHGSRDLSTLLR
jgi:toxin ParE1/3/4